MRHIGIKKTGGYRWDAAAGNKKPVHIPADAHKHSP